LIKEAFTAIKKNDWAAYSRLTVTAADFMLRENKIGPFEEKQSYAGSVLKPEEIQSQRAQFESAVEGGDGLIDFRNAEFVALGSIVEKGDHPLLTGGSVPFVAYSVRINVDGKEFDSRELSPRFVVVKWGHKPRLLRLLFNE
jgi:hypothetical protein